MFIRPTIPINWSKSTPKMLSNTFTHTHTTTKKLTELKTLLESEEFISSCDYSFNVAIVAGSVASWLSFFSVLSGFTLLLYRKLISHAHSSSFAIAAPPLRSALSPGVRGHILPHLCLEFVLVFGVLLGGFDVERIFKVQQVLKQQDKC